MKAVVTEADLATADGIIARGAEPSAQSVFLGDKTLLFNANRDAFVRFTGRFYNFEGLREFKESFDPEWEPRYLASSPGIARSLVLAHLAALTSGGITGMFRK